MERKIYQAEEMVFVRHENGVCPGGGGNSFTGTAVTFLLAMSRFKIKKQLQQ